AARRGSIGLAELAGLEVIHGPRRADPGTYDAWTSIVRTADPRFAFTDPPLRHSLPVALALAATAGRPAAVLTGPAATAHVPPGGGAPAAPPPPAPATGPGSAPRASRGPPPPPWSGPAPCPARCSRSSSTPPTA